MPSVIAYLANFLMPRRTQFPQLPKYHLQRRREFATESTIFTLLIGGPYRHLKVSVKTASVFDSTRISNTAAVLPHHSQVSYLRYCRLAANSHLTSSPNWSLSPTTSSEHLTGACHQTSNSSHHSQAGQSWFALTPPAFINTKKRLTHSNQSPNAK